MDKYTEKIALYLEDALSEQETTELKKHLNSCMNCQAEYTSLKQIDQLFSTAPTFAPAPGFVARFETRLEHRRNKRRTWVGVAIISTILIFATILLGWIWADSGLALLSILNNLDILNSLYTFIQTISVVANLFVNVTTLIGGAVLQIMRHPAFWGYVALTTGLVTLWAQMLRWFQPSQQSVTT